MKVLQQSFSPSWTTSLLPPSSGGSRPLIFGYLERSRDMDQLFGRAAWIRCLAAAHEPAVSQHRTDQLFIRVSWISCVIELHWFLAVHQQLTGSQNLERPGGVNSLNWSHCSVSALHSPVWKKIYFTLLQRCEFFLNMIYHQMTKVLKTSSYNNFKLTKQIEICT